ncbi:MAG TPA: hypothetical protein PLA74_08025 [Syntrophales bacterium]|nr:hypothetical protein [Syntrophales bacterium]
MLTRKDHFCKERAFLLFIITVVLVLTFPSLVLSEENPRGLDPRSNATYMPILGGLRHGTWHNAYGQKRDLAECVVLRQSSIKDGKAYVSPGGLYYVSETSYDARPLMRDPFLILGEHAYLVRATQERVVKRDVTVKKGDKELLDPLGYRIWFDYATDHYMKPYGEFALIAPSGGWPNEWPISTAFPQPEKVKELDLEGGIHPQQRDFIMGKSYLYGATHLTAKDIDFDKAVFSKIEYPVIKEAIFSMERPWVAHILQETFRWVGNKRLYAFRKENGVLVEVRNWTGKKVLASKLLVPSTQQEYKSAEQDKMCLTSLDLDLHIELIVDPMWFNGSDYAPWVNAVPYGWDDGTISFAVFSDLVKVENGKPWPMDERYIVGLESNYQTGMLQRLTLENRDAFVLSDENTSYDGPTKISEVWDRKYFTVVAKDFEKDVVKNCYLRDCFFQRTDNMILWKEGRENIDFFVGETSLFAPVMEDTFLTRLADPTYGVPVVKSRFTSYPKVIPSAKWFAPDPNCAFVPKMKGFVRKFVRTRDGNKITASEALVIRQSYVDYRKKKIIIPPAGLYYTTRDSRNIRPGEPLYVLGKQAYLLGFKSYLVVKRDFRVDFWKEQPMGDDNPLFWQDVPLGDGSKALRYLGSSILWGRPVSELRITKYSGNNWGANILTAHGFYDYDDLTDENSKRGPGSGDQRYYLPSMFTEGATYMIPKWIAPDFVEVDQLGTPGMDEFTITYKKPQDVVLKEGEQAPVGKKYRLVVKKVDTGNKAAECVLIDSKGTILAEKTFGPVTEELVDTFPQYGPSQQKITLQYEDIYINMDITSDFAGGKCTFYIATGAQTFKRDEPWPADPRFMVRPDVCGHCYQLNEIILDNKDPIVLDAENPVYTALGGYFKIVIDDFDGESINAWHIEDRFGKKTSNLAEYRRNNVDVMVGVNGTVESFLRRTILERLAYREEWRLN